MGKAEVENLEARIDATWLGTQLPAEDWRQCAHAFLTFVEMSLQDMGPEVADNFKYLLRSLMDLARLNCRSNIVQDELIPIRSAHKVCSDALDAADAYESAKLAFGCYWRGEATYHSSGGMNVFTSSICARHEMLDQLVVAHDRHSKLTDNPMPWIVSTVIRDGKCDRHSRLTYKYRPSIPRRMARAFPKTGALLPSGWRAWDVDTVSVQKTLTALVYRCIYHCTAIRTLAQHHQAMDRGANDLVLRIGWTQLVNQVASLAEVPIALAQRILTAMRFGEDTNTPDPALQPIIPVGRNEVMVPCWTVGTSNVERNLLSLQARVRTSEFDNQSHLFERRMIKQITDLLDAKGMANMNSFASAAGEVDLAFSSTDGSVVFIAELKWCLPPGDGQETLRRMDVVRKGTTQIQKKLSACTTLPSLETDLGLEKPPSSYVGLMIMDGFSAPTQAKDIACVPLTVFKRWLECGPLGKDLTAKLQSQPWLPTKGVHFEQATQEHALGADSFSWVSHSLLAKSSEIAQAWVGAR